MKKYFLMIIIIAMIILSLSVVSCAEKVSIRFSWWGSQVRNDITLKVIKMFEEKYPDINVVPEYTGYGGYWTKINIQAAGSNLPDVFQISTNHIKIYANNSEMLNLNPYVNNGTLKTNTINPKLLNSANFDGKLLALIQGASPLAILYDKELFKKAGIEKPDNDWTWEDFMDISRKIHTKLGIFAATELPMSTADPYLGLNHYLIQHGKSYYNKTQTGLGYDDDRFFVDYYNMDLELIKEGVFAPPDLRREVTGIMENDLITKQKSAMACYWAVQAVGVCAAAGKELGLLPLPNAKDQVQKGGYSKPSIFYSVAKNSKYPEAAVKFINFIINDIEANKILKVERGIPTASHIRDAIKPYLNDLEVKIVNFSTMIEKESAGVPAWPPSEFNEIDDLSKNIAYKMLYGILTPKKAAKDFRNEVNNILTKK